MAYTTSHKRNQHQLLLIRRCCNTRSNTFEAFRVPFRLNGDSIAFRVHQDAYIPPFHLRNAVLCGCGRPSCFFSSLSGPQGYQVGIYSSLRCCSLLFLLPGTQLPNPLIPIFLLQSSIGSVQSAMAATLRDVGTTSCTCCLNPMYLTLLLCCASTTQNLRDPTMQIAQGKGQGWGRSAVQTLNGCNVL